MEPLIMGNAMGLMFLISAAEWLQFHWSWEPFFFHWCFRSKLIAASCVAFISMAAIYIWFQMPSLGNCVRGADTLLSPPVYPTAGVPLSLQCPPVCSFPWRILPLNKHLVPSKFLGQWGWLVWLPSASTLGSDLTMSVMCSSFQVLCGWVWRKQWNVSK